MLPARAQEGSVGLTNKHVPDQKRSVYTPLLVNRWPPAPFQRVVHDIVMNKCKVVQDLHGRCSIDRLSRQLAERLAREHHQDPAHPLAAAVEHVGRGITYLRGSTPAT